MTDGTGVTSYTYHPAGQLEAGQVASVEGPLTDDTIAYSYDAVGRVTSRAINGAANTVTWTFDALGRVTTETNLLGTFTYTYDGATSRVATLTYPNGQSSGYSYFDNLTDRRLQTIHHKYPNGTTRSRCDYTYDAVGNILSLLTARGAPPPRASLLAFARREGRWRCGSRRTRTPSCGSTATTRRTS